MAKRVQSESWFTRGTFAQRIAREMLFIAPVTLLLGYYFVYARAHQDISLAAYVAIALLVAAAISAYNASRPVRMVSKKD